MSHPMRLAPGGTHPLSSAEWTSRREARLRPEHAHLYPGIRAGMWEVAAVVVDRIVAARLLACGNMAIQGRVLSDSHFEFRGGTEAGARPRREDR
jgi:hypothetical protein